MAEKFTPGPLEVRHGDGCFIIYERQGYPVGSAYGGNKEVDMANAYMFAAAPDMFEVLKIALDYVLEYPIGIDTDPLETRGGPRHNMIIDIQTALAKARGERKQDND